MTRRITYALSIAPLALLTSVASAQTSAPPPTAAAVGAPRPGAPPPMAAPASAAPPGAPPPTAAPASAAPPAPGPYVYPPYPPYPPPAGHWELIPMPAPPKTLPYRADAPIPAGYHVEEHHPRWALITGAGLFVGFYLAAALDSSGHCGLAACTNGSTRSALVIPLFGPFIDMGKDQSASAKTSDVLYGAGQILGATFLIYGLATKTKVLILNTAQASLEVLPRVGASSASIDLRLQL